MKRPIIGLAQLPRGVAFKCGHCKYFKRFGSSDDGRCLNSEAKLYERKVEAETMCCDYYRHEGMRVIVP